MLVLETRISMANVNGRMDHLGVGLRGKCLLAAAFENHTLDGDIRMHKP